MNISHDPVGIEEGRVWLNDLPGLCYALLGNAQLEVQPETQAISCNIPLPGIGKREIYADSVQEAIRGALVSFTDLLVELSYPDWPEEWRQLVNNQITPTPLKIKETRKEMERFQAKARQVTIGVTMPTELKESIQCIAEEQSLSFAEVAREVVSEGFEDFDERVFSESPKELIESLAMTARNWAPSEKEQVMLRVNPRLGIRIRTTAQEFQRSASEMGVLFLANGFELKMKIPELEKKITDYKGPPMRKLATRVGLDKCVPLLSSIFDGSVSAPKLLLKRLGNELGAPVVALEELLKRANKNRSIPAFKSEDGKPEINSKIMSWEEAVNTMDLPDEKREELIGLKD